MIEMKAMVLDYPRCHEALKGVNEQLDILEKDYRSILSNGPTSDDDAVRIFKALKHQDDLNTLKAQWEAWENALRGALLSLDPKVGVYAFPDVSVEVRVFSWQRLKLAKDYGVKKGFRTVLRKGLVEGIIKPTREYWLEEDKSVTLRMIKAAAK